MYHMYHLTFTQCFTCFRKKDWFFEMRLYGISFTMTLPFFHIGIQFRKERKKKAGKIRRRRNSIQQQILNRLYSKYILLPISRWNNCNADICFWNFQFGLKVFHWNSHGKLAPKDPSFSSFYRRKSSAKYSANTFTVSDRE